MLLNAPPEKLALHGGIGRIDAAALEPSTKAVLVDVPSLAVAGLGRGERRIVRPCLLTQGVGSKPANFGCLFDGHLAGVDWRLRAGCLHFLSKKREAMSETATPVASAIFSNFLYASLGMRTLRVFVSDACMGFI